MAISSAELNVIGSILISPESMYHVYNRLRPSMFASEFLRESYSAMIRLYDRNTPISVETLAVEMESDIYDRETLTHNFKYVFLNTETSANISSMADVVLEEHRARELIRILNSVKVFPKDVKSTIGDLIVKLEELNATNDSTIQTMAEVVDENSGNYFREKDVVQGISTGFPKLDEALFKVEKGDVMIVSARPSVGKSAFVTQVADYNARNGKRVVLFNLEMRNSQIYERFLTRTSGLELTRIREAKCFLNDEETHFNNANDKLRKYDVILPKSVYNLGDIKRICKNASADLIIIDYLQLIQPDKTVAGGRTQEVGYISRSIKNMAKELDVPVIMLSQLNRRSENTDTKEPQMSDLREAGDIEQDASQIVMLWNLSDKDLTKKGCKIEKNRQGILYRECLEFNGKYMDFKESKETISEIMKNIGNSSSDNPDSWVQSPDDLPFS